MNGNTSPSLTIGLAVYNGAEFLEETLDSILAQTYTNYKLIISDNASTDRTEAICRSYAGQDPRIQYIRQRENIGACANFNFLFTEARGRYFKWAAADDLLALDYLARCVELLETRPEFVLCHSRTKTIDPSGRELPNDIIRSSGAAENPFDLAKGFDRPWRRFRGVLLGNGNPVFDTAVIDFYGIIRSDVLGNTGLLQPYIGYEKILMATLALQGRIAELPEALFAYRLHPKAVSNQTSAGALRAWSDPQQKSSSYPRLQYLKGYFRNMLRLNLKLYDRLFCCLVILQYVFQVKKWKRVVLSSLFGKGIGLGNVEILRQNSVDIAAFSGHDEGTDHG